MINWIKSKQEFVKQYQDIIDEQIKEFDLSMKLGGNKEKQLKLHTQIAFEKIKDKTGNDYNLPMNYYQVRDYVWEHCKTNPQTTLNI